MPTLSQFAAFGAACVVLIAVPGPSVMFIIGRTLSLGRSAALATVLGNALGSYTVGVVVSLGIGPLVQRLPTSLVIIKLVGAAFLCWLGIQAFRSRNVQVPDAVSSNLDRRAVWTAVRQGYLVGITNPKAFVIFGIVMPSFLSTTMRPFALQMVLLAITPILIGLISDSAWAVFSGMARRWFSGSPRRIHILNMAGGVLMISVGVLVAVT